MNFNKFFNNPNIERGADIVDQWFLHPFMVVVSMVFLLPVFFVLWIIGTIAKRNNRTHYL